MGRRASGPPRWGALPADGGAWEGASAPEQVAQRVPDAPPSLRSGQLASERIWADLSRLQPAQPGRIRPGL